MATSYALPLNGSGNLAHSHFSHGHTRSQHRKAVPERLALAQAPTNGAAQPDLGTFQRNGQSISVRPHMHSESLPQNYSVEPRQARPVHHHSTVQHQPGDLKNSGPQTIHMDHSPSRSLAALSQLRSEYGFADGEKNARVSPFLSTEESRR